MYREFTEEEMKWIKSFERIMKKAPTSLFLFVGPGIVIHAKENGQRPMNGGVVDTISTSYDISTPMEFDGGDY